MDNNPLFLFDSLGYKRTYVDGSKNNCEDAIVYHEEVTNFTIQFNLISKSIVFKFDNKFVNYEKIVIFITKELIEAIYEQAKELRWYDE